MLQSGEVMRLGSNEARHVDVRVVCATHVEMVKARAEKRFREDLYHRLAGFTLGLPRLADRIEDLPRLVHHFLRKDGPAGEQVELSLEALAKLVSHPYPRNVRELELVIRRALGLRLGQGPIQPIDINFEAHGTPGQPDAAEVRPERGEDDWLDLRGQTEEAAVREIRRRAIRRHGGNKTAAADELGISRTTLRDIDLSDE